jgi:hypothetical protein
MPKRRSDAGGCRFFDEFLCVKIPRLRAMGVVQLDAPHAIIESDDRQKLIRLAHTGFAMTGAGLSSAAREATAAATGSGQSMTRRAVANAARPWASATARNMALAERSV